MQKNATGDDAYKILDLMETWISGLNRTVAGKRIAYQSVKSFFRHNRAELPKASFKITSEKRVPPPQLQVEDIVRLAQTANVRDRSIILFKWQSLQDSARLAWIGKNSAEQIVKQIKKEIHPVRVDIPERKDNKKDYYTFIGRDAIDALVKYFENERGWPKKGEAVWLNTQRKALSIQGFQAMWLSMCRRAGLVQKQRGEKGSRFGFNAHETRDLAKTTLHLNALGKGFDLDACEYWMGHTVDPLGYDKFYKDEKRMREQYLIAEEFLNIISKPTIPTQVGIQSDEIKQLQEQVNRLQRDQLYQELESYFYTGFDTRYTGSTHPGEIVANLKNKLVELGSTEKEVTGFLRNILDMKLLQENLFGNRNPQEFVQKRVCLFAPELHKEYEKIADEYDRVWEEAEREEKERRGIEGKTENQEKEIRRSIWDAADQKAGMWLGVQMEKRAPPIDRVQWKEMAGGYTRTRMTDIQQREKLLKEKTEIKGT